MIRDKRRKKKFWNFWWLKPEKNEINPTLPAHPNWAFDESKYEKTDDGDVKKITPAHQRAVIDNTKEKINNERWATAKKLFFEK